MIVFFAVLDKISSDNFYSIDCRNPRRLELSSILFSANRIESGEVFAEVRLWRSNCPKSVKLHLMGRWGIIPGVNLYFAITTIVEWQNVFVFIPLFEAIIESLKFCCASKGLHLHGYVIMPNHAHYLLSVNSPEKLSDIMRDFNRFTSKSITTLLEETNRFEMLEVFHQAASEEGRNNRYKVWQEGFHPIGIDSEDFFRQKLNYAYENPVRKGFVEKPEHWRYSSARNYLMDDHSVIRVECIA